MKAIIIIKFNKVGAFTPETVRNISREEYSQLLKSTEKLCERMTTSLEQDYFKKAKLDTTITYEVIDE